MKKRIFTVILSLVLVFAMCVPAFAWAYPTTAPTQSSDVWNADVQLRAIKAAATPTVDGNFDKIYGTAAAVNYGFSTLYVLWDAAYLYLYETRNDTTLTGTATAGSQNVWNPKYDVTMFNIFLPATMENNKVAAVAVYISPMESLKTAQTGVPETASVTTRRLLYSNVATGGQSKTWSNADATVKSYADTITSFAVRTQNGYATETRIPWTALCYANTAAAGDNAFEGAVGKVIGFRACQGDYNGSGYGNTVISGDPNKDEGGQCCMTLEDSMKFPDYPNWDVANFEINCSTAAQLEQVFSYARENSYTFAGWTVNLTDNIDYNPGVNCALTNVDIQKTGPSLTSGSVTLPDASKITNRWTVVPSFGGTIDGHGHTLKGIYYDVINNDTSYSSEGDKKALFNNFTGTLKNLVVTNSMVYIHSDTTTWGGYYSSFAKDAVGATISNVYWDVDMYLLTSGNAHTLALASNAGGIKVTNVAIAGTYGAGATTSNFRQSYSGDYGGGFSAGVFNMQSNYNTTFDHVAFVGQVTFPDTEVERQRAGDGGAACSTHFAIWRAYLAGPNYTRMTSKPVWNIYDPKGENFKSVSDIQAAWGDISSQAEPMVAVINQSTDTTPQYAWSVTAGAMIPASLVHMVDYNLAVQQTAVYEGTKSDNSKVNVTDLRLLTTVDELTVCEKIGFKVSVKVGSAEAVEKVITASEVYSSIQAAGATVTAEQLGGRYICGLVLKGVSATENVTVTVTPVKVVGETTYEDPTPYVINVVAGVIQ